MMENEATGNEQVGVAESEEVQAETRGDELAAVRELVLRAHPDTVPELVNGGNVAELLASVEPARAAYLRLAEKLGSRSNPAASPIVPAGTTPPLAIDPDRLPATEKIRRGLASHEYGKSGK